MTTVQEIVALIENTRVDWSATPQSVMSPVSGVITSQKDLEAYQRRDHDLVGYGYFYIDVRNMGADLALMHSTRPGYWETEIIPKCYSPLLPEDLERAVEKAGGAMNWSGHYPLDAWSLEKVRLSYLGQGG